MSVKSYDQAYFDSPFRYVRVLLSGDLIARYEIIGGNYRSRNHRKISERR